MKKKRIYFKTEEIKTTVRRGYFEIDTDYTQIYDSFSLVAKKIRSATSFKLLLWLLANKTNDENGIDSGINTYNDFNNYLSVDCDSCSITYRTFLNCMKELMDSGAVTKPYKGQYFANPYLFWKDETDKRIEHLTEQNKDGNFISLNPIITDETT